MKHIHKLTALTLCVALLLSGCKTDKPAEKSTEASAATSAETTTTTTSEETTSAETSMSEDVFTEPVFTDNKYQEPFYSSSPVLTLDEALRDIDSIRSFDYGSDDMEDVIGRLLAGN
ncbi:MAG: hypothetical protein IK990_00025, partial [Ruminiclostridium sp.]|nr:hypothetical protein [Ruminiclostridium sp.]